MMDTNEMIVAVLGAVTGVVLIAIALRWRRMIVEGPGLPLWRFLRRDGIARDDAAPPANCPNARLLEEFGIGVDSAWK